MDMDFDNLKPLLRIESCTEKNKTTGEAIDIPIPEWMYLEKLPIKGMIRIHLGDGTFLDLKTTEYVEEG
jgi:hypothetical protein